ncbi:MAG: repeat-containing protein [Myxococcales bacterium]|nr:repeat-containing protein [Myxococcales bacterium]
MRTLRRGGSFTALVVALATLGAGGCDWRDFDKLEAETPVLSIGQPSGYSGQDDFGRHLLVLAGPAMDATGGRFIVASANHAELGIMAIDARGVVSGQAFSRPLFGTTEPTLPITSMAQVPGTDKVLLGAPLANVVGSVYVLSLVPTPEVTLLDSPAADERFGLGVAAGALAGGAAPDYVVVSGSQLSVYLDGDRAQAVIAPAPPDTCPLDLSMAVQSRDRTNRAVVVADLMGAGTSQIIVGTPAVMPDAGAVSVFTVDATTGVATCAFSLRSSTGGAPKARFGQSLTTGDFNRDGKLDLLVGAPPSGAFWIPGPLTATSTPLPVALGPEAVSPTGELGYAVAAVDVDGEPGVEALVSDLDAPSEDRSKTLAGEVRVAGGAMLDVAGTTLRRVSPGSNDGFGADVAGLPFCISGCGTPTADVKSVVLVGATKQAYALFKTAPGDTDPRRR